MDTGTITRSDVQSLTKLNSDYVQKGDLKRFEEILADDFKCSNPDGSLIGKSEFLRLTALPVRVTELQADDVQVRVLGDFAIIHARITYRAADGMQHVGRYTDDYAKRGGEWRCVSAHVTGDGWSD
jgi:ketosteroid isomerase-like protein